MRTLTIVLALSALALTHPAMAQLAGPQLPQASPPVGQPMPDGTLPDDQAQAGEDGQNITNIVVVAMEDLPADIKAQAEAVVTRTTAEDLVKLQRSVDASPAAVSALRANGLNSTQVVAANIDGDGTVTLIIQTTA
jgi:hypothetical protein